MMVFFFDRNIGKSIPKALKLVKLFVPAVATSHDERAEVELHQDHFGQETPDDEWLAEVGERGWIVVGFDYKYHRMQQELAALKQYHIACFYLWGASARSWEALRAFARGYDRIVEAARSTPRPFVYRIEKTGLLTSIDLQSYEQETVLTADA